MQDMAAAQVSTSAAEVAYLAAVLSDKYAPLDAMLPHVYFDSSCISHGYRVATPLPFLTAVILILLANVVRGKHSCSA